MSINRKRVFGWSLIGLGLCVVVLSQKIIFPGLEVLLGIEMIVGRENVVYEPDGSYRFTNPGAMVWWTVSVAVIGLMIACAGGWFVFRNRSNR